MLCFQLAGSKISPPYAQVLYAYDYCTLNSEDSGLHIGLARSTHCTVAESHFYSAWQKLPSMLQFEAKMVHQVQCW